MEHGSQIETSFSAIEKTLFCIPFVPEIESKIEKTLLSFCIVTLHFFSPTDGVISLVSVIFFKSSPILSQHYWF